LSGHFLSDTSGIAHEKKGHGVARFGAILGRSFVVAPLLAACSVFSQGESDAGAPEPIAEERRSSTFWDLFANVDDPNVTIEVNKYIWTATLQILDFLPIQTADPFTGVIVFGYGTPPGGSRAYRATVYVQDPALDARALRVALMTRSGPAPAETVRAIEDAILTRARELRIRDTRL
jgi:hypothetical protein